MKTLGCLLVFTIGAGAQAPVPTGPRAFTGMPYSAEQETERVQVLSDGTRISQPSQKVLMYRDSQGRTRNERTLTPNLPGAPTVTFIDINDPASGLHYTLDPKTHTAHRIAPPSQADLTAARSVAQKQRPETSSESLGLQTIEGIQARGTRTTMVYPAGSFGNDRPITVTSEMWMSTDLRIVLQSKMSDPRTGDNTTTLKNISRAEPDPTLFQIPADYQIVEGR